MPRTLIRPSSSNPALWLAAGAAAGVVLGVVLAGRAGGSHRVIGRVRRVMRSASQWIQHIDLSAFAGADDDDATEDPDLDERADDVRIDERVLQAFQNDPVLAERAIEIDELEPGAILLIGRVPTASEAAHAVTIARGTPGVSSVQNHLRIRGRSRR